MDISTVFVASTVVCPLVIAVVLWVYPCTVANILLKPEIDHPIEPMRAKELLTVFILGIGSLSLYNAVIDSVYWATWWQMSLNSQYSAAPLILDVNTKSSMAATALELIVAAIIVFKARTLASKILRLAT
ncbi:MAG: hypothetical protein JKX83_08285 [Pseudomonadales bacterium]|nr:hypothetical protein [Pseudomonadales bacterium]